MLMKLTAVVCLVTVFRPSYSLKCYQCDSINITKSDNQVENCNSGSLKNESLSECGPGYFRCSSVVVYVNEDKRTLRECVGFENVEKCLNVDNQIGFCNLCEYDGCNGSGTLESSTVAIIVGTALAACLFYGHLY